MKFSNLYSKPAAFCLTAALGITLAFSACTKEDDSYTEPKIVTSEDAKDVLENSSATKGNGLAFELDRLAVITINGGYGFGFGSKSCGYTYDSSFQVSAGGSENTFSYQQVYSYILGCDSNNMYNHLAYTNTSSGSYNLSNMSANDNSNSSLVITNLGFLNADFLVSGSYTRTGTFTSKEREMNNFTGTVAYTLTAVKVNKASHRIVGGAATFVVSGVSSTGNAYNYSGTISFSNTNAATVVMSGVNSSFDLY